jgi:hypothetical protein
MNRNILGASALGLGALACRPVLAIGWGEFFILVFVVVLLIGPPVYRLMRRLNFDKYVDRKDKTGK